MIKLQNKRNLVLLHLGFLVHSFSEVLLKQASGEPPLSFNFLLFYGLAILVLIIYSAYWQIMLRRFRLSTAFANRGVGVIWGILWGMLIFGETLTVGKVIAATLIMTGVAVLGRSHE